MSIHDETWDKCPKCKNTIKSWHGEFHNSGGCLNFAEYNSWHNEVLNKCVLAYEAETAAQKKDPVFEQEFQCEFVDECTHCHDVIEDGQSDYHSQKYCLRYPYSEYLNLKNERPAKEYTMGEKLNKGLIPEQPLWQKSNSKTFADEYNCFEIPVVKHPVFGSSEYIPEKVTLLKDSIYAAISALEAGLEYAQECLLEHDRRLGRTIRRNREWAENIEIDIKKIKKSIEELKI